MQWRIQHVIFVHIGNDKSCFALPSKQVCKAVPKFDGQSFFDEFIQIFFGMLVKSEYGMEWATSRMPSSALYRSKI